MIKAAIFDMDGLLVDSEPLWRRVIVKAYADLGIKITKEHHHSMTGKRTRDNAAYMYRKHKWEGPTPDELTDAINAEMVRSARGEVVLRPGVHHVLSVCRKAGLPVAIASSSEKVVIDAVVDAVEIREHFDHIYSAQYEEDGKPHPAVFLKVARHFKVPPHDCLVFEDSPNGVLAAKAAQMRCVAVPDPAVRDHPFVRTADIVLESLADFDETMLRELGKPIH
jgi:sugar-phosphatase